MTCKKIWDFGVLGGMRASYLLLFWSAPIHSDPLLLMSNAHQEKSLFSFHRLIQFGFSQLFKLG